MKNPGSLVLVVTSLIVALSPLLAGCPEPAPADCIVGNDEDCSCDDGATGRATCSASGLGPCVCGEGEGEGGEGEGEGDVGEGEGEPVDQGPCADGDGDGFHPCVDAAFPDRPVELDCNDRDRSVAPGGIDFPDNDRDDDCDDDVDEPEPVCACDGVGSGGGSDAGDVLAGIGLCGATVLSSSLSGEPGQLAAFDRYFALEGRNADGCFSGLSSGIVEIDETQPQPTDFDPYVFGLFEGVVETAQTEPTSEVRCTLDGDPLEPCEQILDLSLFDASRPHVLAVVAVDVAGNVEPLPLLLVFGGDGGVVPEDPEIVVLFPVDGDRVGERTPTLSGTAAPGAIFSILLTGPDGEEVFLVPTVDESGGWSANPQDVPTALARGPWSMSGSVSGGVDGVDEPALSLTFVVDTAGGDNVPPDTRLTPDGPGVRIVASEDEAEVVCAVDDVPVACDVGLLDLSELEAGVHVVTTTATDPAGNVELVPTQLSVLVGASTELALLSPEPNQRTSETRFSIIGTAPPRSDVSLFIDGDPLPTASQLIFFEEVSTAADDNGRFVYPASSMTALAPGSHTITAEIFDFDTFETLTTEVVVVVDPAAGDTTPPATIALYDGFGGVSSAVSTEFFTFGEDPTTGEFVNDPASITVELQVPPNALGFQLDLMFISVEWPEYLCNEFNDAVRLIVETGAVDAGDPTNVALDTNEDPITVNVGFFELPSEWTTDVSSLPHAADLGDDAFPCSEPFVGGCELPDYCDDGSDVSFEGSGSGWLKTRAPVVPGETVRLTFLVYDAADSSLDSVAFFDGFRWLPFAPPVGTVKE